MALNCSSTHVKPSPRLNGVYSAAGWRYTALGNFRNSPEFIGPLGSMLPEREMSADKKSRWPTMAVNLVSQPVQSALTTGSANSRLSWVCKTSLGGIRRRCDWCTTSTLVLKNHVRLCLEPARCSIAWERVLSNCSCSGVAHSAPCRSGSYGVLQPAAALLWILASKVFKNIVFPPVKDM